MHSYSNLLGMKKSLFLHSSSCSGRSGEKEATGKATAADRRDAVYCGVSKRSTGGGAHQYWGAQEHGICCQGTESSTQPPVRKLIMVVLLNSLLQFQYVLLVLKMSTVLIVEVCVRVCVFVCVQVRIHSTVMLTMSTTCWMTFRNRMS